MDLESIVEEVKGEIARDVLGERLLELGADNDSVVVLAADTIGSLRGKTFAERFPERAFNYGIAEQNLMGVGAGFAKGGKIPFVGVYAFLFARAAEQIRTDICYPNLNVKLYTTSPGLSMAEGGVTHQSYEDVPILRSFPNMTIVQPGAPIENYFGPKALIEQINGPTYFRTTRVPYKDEAEEAVNSYYLKGGEFKIGKANLLRKGNDVTLIATGVLLGEALQAANDLQEEGISTRVINMHTIKPLDKETILSAAAETEGIVTIECANILGGMGEGVSGIVSEKAQAPVKRIGIPDQFCEIGPREKICENTGLCKSNIVDVAKSLLAKEGVK